MRSRKRRFLILLLAFFFHIDGVYTIIDMATVMHALGFATTGLLLALLLTQTEGFPLRYSLGGWRKI